MYGCLASQVKIRMDSKHPPSNSITVSLWFILLLFFTSRLMLLLAFPPENLIVYGDYQHYFNLADMTRRGFYPYFNYWYEFPPIFPYLNIAIYTLAGQQLKNYILLLAFALLLVECGNFYLLYKLALTLYGRTSALTIAWIYTALFIPVFFWLGNFDALTTFFILLALYSLIHNKPKMLAAALGLGTMVKYLPIILLATIWRARGFKSACLYGLATLAISLIVFSPFLLRSPDFTLASLRAQAGKSSYETIWALVDGNTTTGNFGPLADHFDPVKASIPLNRPARIPTWLTLLVFGAVGLFIFTRPRLSATPNLDSVRFTTLTFTIFFLWSPGWSPQWQTFLVPLLLLSFPASRAVLFIIALGFINFLEWPVMLSRGFNNLLPVTIVARTLLFILLAVDLYRLLVHPTTPVNQEKINILADRT